jgi:multiple sugar transport system permease protein
MAREPTNSIGPEIAGEGIRSPAGRRTILRGAGPGAARRPWSFERYGFIAVFALPALVLVVAVWFYPIVYAFKVSLYQTRYLQLGEFIGFANYVTLVQDPAVWHLMLNSVVYMLGSVVVTVPLGLALALMLNRRLPLMGTFRGILVTPWVISQPVAAVLWLWLLDPSMGPISYLIQATGHAKVRFLSDPMVAMVMVILANIWLSYPFPMILFLAALRGVPAELYEAIQLDGAGRGATFRYVVFPFLRPTLLSTVILVSLLYLNMVALIYIMTGGGPLSATETLAVSAFKVSFKEFHIGLGAALGTIIFLLTVVFGSGYVRMLQQREEAIY